VLGSTQSFAQSRGGMVDLARKEEDRERILIGPIKDDKSKGGGATEKKRERKKVSAVHFHPLIREGEKGW